MAEKMIALSKVREIVEVERAQYLRLAKALASTDVPRYSASAVMSFTAGELAEVLDKIAAAAEAPHA